MLFGSVALSIDAMLPALPQIAAELSPAAPNQAQLVVTSFFFGMGFGTLIAGPISDRFGRKPVLLVCAAIYLAGTALSTLAPSLETLLFARALQGLGAAAPRVVGMAMVRDLHKGREMARIVSLVMMIFMMAPAAAPLLGQVILAFGSWRMIFVVVAGLAVLANAWALLRQPETLPPGARRSLGARDLWLSAREFLGHRTAVVSTACQTLGLACLLATLSSQQGIFEQTFDRKDSFAAWFGFISFCAACGSLINSRIVMRLGMRRVIVATYLAELLLSLALLAGLMSGLLPEAVVFPIHVIWSVTVIAMMGLTQGNLSAMAMEDLGHVAGLASSLMTAVSTVVAVILAVPVGLAFDGTQVPLVVGISFFCAAALVLMRVGLRRA